MVKTIEKVQKDKDTEFVIQKHELIEDDDTGEKFVTITISQKMLHYIFEGLSKFKEGLGDSLSSMEEKEKTNKLIDEFNKVKDVLTEEVDLDVT